MKKPVTVLLTTICLLVATGVYAQDKFKVELGYSIAAPLGSFKDDFTNNTSFRGMTGEIAYAFNRKFCLGLRSGFQNYYQRYGRATYKLNNTQTVSALLTNTMQIVPVMLAGTYTPMGTKTLGIQPCISLAAGVNLVNYEQYLGVFANSDQSGAFAAQGSLGVKIPFKAGNTGWGLKVGGTYSYGHYERNNIDQLNTIGGNISAYLELK